MHKINFRSTFFTIIMIAWNSETKKPISRITGGQDASSEYYTNIVRIELKVPFPLVIQALVIKFIHHCTATVLTSTWVLTASHCIDEFEKVERIPNIKDLKLVIRYGSAYSIPWSNDSFSAIIHMIKHPSYQQFELHGRIFMKNDIGLLNTAPIMVDRYRKLSAVDYSTLVGQKTVAAGYGITNVGALVGDTLTLRKSLQVMDVLVRKCSEEHQMVYPVMCLSRRCGDTGSICPGDSGGPLLHPSGVVGVISMGLVTDCFQIVDKNNNWFAIITPVSPYIQWISGHINNKTN